MPFVNIQLKEGRTKEQKAQLAKDILDLMEDTGFASREAVQVIFEDMKDGDYYSGRHH